MMTEADITDALAGWRSAASVLRDLAGDETDQMSWSAGLAEGYASALEMVLRV